RVRRIATIATSATVRVPTTIARRRFSLRLANCSPRLRPGVRTGAIAVSSLAAGLSVSEAKASQGAVASLSLAASVTTCLAPGRGSPFGSRDAGRLRRGLGAGCATGARVGAGVDGLFFGAGLLGGGVALGGGAELKVGLLAGELPEICVTALATLASC